MSDVDRCLLYKARNLLNAANLEHLNTWILCYEHSPNSSELNRYYEKLLEEFAVAANIALALEAHLACSKVEAANAASDILNAVIERLITK
jgi:hypothetical protein